MPTEKAAALKQQVEDIKHQRARPGEDDRDAGKRSTQIVGDRNGMNYKQVQRYIRLTELIPDLQKMVDEKQLSFTPPWRFLSSVPGTRSILPLPLRGRRPLRPFPKPTAIAFAVALELPLVEAREMLEKAGFAFSHACKFDIIVE